MIMGRKREKNFVRKDKDNKIASSIISLKVTLFLSLIPR